MADVPDAQDRFVVGQQRRGRMRVVVTRLRRAAGNDDLPSQIVREINLLDRVPLSHPAGSGLRRCLFPGPLRGIGGHGSFRRSEHQASQGNDPEQNGNPPGKLIHGLTHWGVGGLSLSVWLNRSGHCRRDDAWQIGRHGIARAALTIRPGCVLGHMGPSDRVCRSRSPQWPIALSEGRHQSPSDQTDIGETATRSYSCSSH
jgi:hypothetical protein